MSILRTTLEQCKTKGTIRIIIGRQAKIPSSNIVQTSGASSPVPPASPSTQLDGTPLKRSSPSVTRKNFKRPESPSLSERRSSSGRKTPERFSPRLEMRRKNSVERRKNSVERQQQEKKAREEKVRRRLSSGSGADSKEFDERYLQRGLTPGHYAVSRNKSYFRAVNIQPVATTTTDIDINEQPTDSRRTVSVSSTEIPIVQRSVPVFLDPENELRNSTRSNNSVFGGGKPLPLPSYEEALNRRSSSSSANSSEKTDSRTNSFKALPDKYFAISKEPQNTVVGRTLSMESNLPEKYFLPTGVDLHKQISMKKSLSLDSLHKGLLSPGAGDLSETEISRSNTLASQCSLDSILHGSFQFSRDGFGRLSISEKKGRGHIDATESQFYNKLKKFKSMEELRPASSHDDVAFGGKRCSLFIFKLVLLILIVLCLLDIVSVDCVFGPTKRDSIMLCFISNVIHFQLAIEQYKTISSFLF